MRQGIAMALIVALGIVGGSVLSQVGSADAGPRQGIERDQLRALRGIKASVEKIEFTLGADPVVKQGIRAAVREICRELRPGVGYNC